MKSKEVFDAHTYPEDGEYVIYYFEPFESWYTGKFYLEDSEESLGPVVVGKYGFTTWHTEVTMWMKGGKEE